MKQWMGLFVVGATLFSVLAWGGSANKAFQVNSDLERGIWENLKKLNAARKSCEGRVALNRELKQVHRELADQVGAYFYEYEDDHQLYLLWRNFHVVERALPSGWQKWWGEAAPVFADWDEQNRIVEELIRGVKALDSASSERRKANKVLRFRKIKPLKK